MSEFPQSPLSNAGQATALNEEITPPIAQVGNTIVTQLPQEMWHQTRASHKLSLEAHTVIYHKATFCQTPAPNQSVCSPGEGIFLSPLFSLSAQQGKGKWRTFWVMIKVTGIS